jgi:hypothetical protein
MVKKWLTFSLSHRCLVFLGLPIQRFFLLLERLHSLARQGVCLIIESERTEKTYNKGQAFKDKVKNLNIKSDRKENKPKNNNVDLNNIKLYQDEESGGVEYGRQVLVRNLHGFFHRFFNPNDAWICPGTSSRARPRAYPGSY